MSKPLDLDVAPPEGSNFINAEKGRVNNIPPINFQARVEDTGNASKTVSPSPLTDFEAASKRVSESGAAAAKEAGQYGVAATSSEASSSGKETTNSERTRSAEPMASKKTIGGAPRTDNFPKAAQRVGLDSILPKMAKAMQAASASSGVKNEAFQIVKLKDSYLNSLKLLVKEYTYTNLVKVLEKAFLNNGIRFIDTLIRQPVVVDAHMSLYAEYLSYGEENISIVEYNKVTGLGEIPDNIVSVVPPLFYQEYYLFEKHPYPAYIEWRSFNSEDILYTLRNIDDDFYETPEDEIIALSFKRLFKKLKPYFRDNNLTTPILNKILLDEIENLKDDLWETALGKGSKSKAGSMSSDIMGKVASSLKNQLNTQVPRSVLNKSSIQKSQKKMAENQSTAKQTRNRLNESVKENPLKLCDTTECLKNMGTTSPIPLIK